MMGFFCSDYEPEANPEVVITGEDGQQSAEEISFLGRLSRTSSFTVIGLLIFTVIVKMK